MTATVEVESKGGSRGATEGSLAQPLRFDALGRGSPLLIMNLLSFSSSVAGLAVSHSQTTRTLKPSFLNCSCLASSRALFLRSFGTQYSTFLRGTRAKAQPECRCQKQPCTKMATLRLRIAMSGVPGKLLTLTRKRYPRRWRADRVESSGFVSRDRMRAMISDFESGCRALFRPAADRRIVDAIKQRCLMARPRHPSRSLAAPSQFRDALRADLPNGDILKEQARRAHTPEPAWRERAII